MEFEVDIREHTYIIDLKNYVQILKGSDPKKQRPITRENQSSDIVIQRENRSDFKDDATKIDEKNDLKSHTEMDNLQKKKTVREILLYGDKDDCHIDLLKEEILLTPTLIEELDHEFTKDNEDVKKFQFEDEEKILEYVFKEIKNQAETYLKIDKHDKIVNILDSQMKDKPNYIKEAEAYKIKLNEKSYNSLHEKIIYLYTLEGFLVYSVNSILRNGSMQNSFIHVYFILLQASIKFANKTINKEITKKALVTVEGKEYYKLYRGQKNSEKFLIKDEAKLEKDKWGRFLVYQNFLSTSYDVKQAERFLPKELKEGEARVLYTFLIPKIEFDENNRNLMCFIEDCSAYKSEKEVLISSCSIFQIIEVKKKQTRNNLECWDVLSHFISNGFNQFDFVNYYTGNFLYLRGEIQNEKIDFIVDALNINKTTHEVDLSNNKLGKHEAKYLAEYLKNNTVVTKLILNDNKLCDESAEYIAESLKTNKTLTEINLNKNKIGNKGVKIILESLEKNESLITIYIKNNSPIGDEEKIIMKEICEKKRENNKILKIIY